MPSKCEHPKAGISSKKEIAMGIFALKTIFFACEPMAKPSLGEIRDRADKRL
ncbi:hypothetical protein HYX08_05620 [Candidatus Woesearchaeota archaeon]|nr:hypothetical protein [Candidatus Woesearchaeota archaeon]